MSLGFMFAKQEIPMNNKPVSQIDSARNNVNKAVDNLVERKVQLAEVQAETNGQPRGGANDRNQSMDHVSGARQQLEKAVDGLVKTIVDSRKK